MINEKTKQTFWNKLFSGSGWALFTMFVWEMIEEGVEELLAFCISSALTAFVAKAFSTLAIISLTQGIKVSMKRFLKPLIKSVTYKEGNDKMDKIKKGFLWIFANKKSLVGVGSAAVITLSGSGVINVNGLPHLEIAGFNITPLIYYLCLAILSLVGIFGKGFEKVQTYFERVGVEKEIKQTKAIKKEAIKELKAEEKKANQTQAEQEKAKAKEEAKAKADEEKRIAEAEHRAKIEEAKAQIKSEQSKVDIAEAN